MIIDVEDSLKCPAFSLKIEDTSRDIGRRNGGRYPSKISASRRQGLPYVTLEAKSYHDLDGNALDDVASFLLDMQVHDVDLTPEEAVELGNALIRLAEDCRKYPDRRVLYKRMEKALE